MARSQQVLGPPWPLSHFRCPYLESKLAGEEASDEQWSPRVVPESGHSSNVAPVTARMQGSGASMAVQEATHPCSAPAQKHLLLFLEHFIHYLPRCSSLQALHIISGSLRQTQPTIVSALLRLTFRDTERVKKQTDPMTRKE